MIPTSSPPYIPQTPQFTNVVNSAVPGMPGLSRSASSIIGNQLGGLPGTSTARRDNAYFGGASGVPGSDFVRNRGFDLYNMQGEQRQQQGIQNLLAMLQGFSGPMMQERGQEIQRDQFGAQFGQSQLEADRAYDLNRKQSNFLYKPKLNRYAGTKSYGPGGTTQPSESGGTFTPFFKDQWRQ